uniref:TPM domain-containing protein n=1 Tax=Setaria digitata TaxID=48799 RepID=A0A915PP29_9BILA
MHFLLKLFTIPLLVQVTWTQFSSQTYPDPRIDPFTCKVPTVGPVCDPSELLTFDEKKALGNRIKQLLTYAATVPNTSPTCRLFPGKSLDILIAVVDRIGTTSIGSVDIEKFANNLKIRYQHYQDVSLCDLLILIVNSKSDRQVFTVAGKDTKLTKDVLKTAFERNIDHFRANHFAIGLQGMAEFIAKSYHDAQIPQIGIPISTVTALHKPHKNEVITPLTNGVHQPAAELSTEVSITLPGFHSEFSGHNDGNEIGGENLVVPIEDESDQLWIDILTQAVARCGNNREKVAQYVQAIVDEAMSFSLRLISDKRYSTIEESAQAVQDDPDSRLRAWNKAKDEFIDQLYQKYLTNIRSKANLRCPTKS